MKIISIIGTRPQYIKLKPIDSFCKQNNIDHVSLDTNQHYSESVSDNIKKDLDLIIDHNLYENNKGLPEIEFITNTIILLKKFLLKQKDKDHDLRCLIYGDTNSSFAAALVCYKMRIPFAHIEAGARCWDNKVPEEINRIFVDSASSKNFCTSKDSLKNIDNGILTGDLEYELLNDLNIEKHIADFSVMTLHRQSNMTRDRLEAIFSFCGKINNEIILPIHHRLKNEPALRKIDIPSNITFIDPLPFTEMARILSSCKNILSDSGGVLKTAPFFGKKILILREAFGWIEVAEEGYARVATFSNSDLEWLQENNVERNPDFYMFNGRPSEIIIHNILNKNS